MTAVAPDGTAPKTPPRLYLAIDLLVLTIGPGQDFYHDAVRP